MSELIAPFPVCLSLRDLCPHARGGHPGLPDPLQQRRRLAAGMAEACRGSRPRHPTPFLELVQLEQAPSGPCLSNLPPQETLCVETSFPAPPVPAGSWR